MCRSMPRSDGRRKTARVRTDWQGRASTTTWPTRTTSRKPTCSCTGSTGRRGRSKSCCDRGSRNGDGSTVDLVRGVLVPRPFRQAVIDVEDALSIEDVAGRPECFGDLALEVEEHREREPHAPPFVGDGRAAKRAAHLARRHAPGSSELAGIEAEMLDPANHSDMVLEENRGPLHGGAVQCLAGAAVAYLGIHRIGADLIADRAAMAACAVARDERLVVDRGVVGTEIAHRRLDSFDGGRHDDHQENGFMPEITLDVYKAMVGQEVGVSRWLEVPQERIDAFADVTEDHQFIHVDPERAKATPFGGTAAHGFLTMSLLAPMAFDAQPTLAGTVMVVNYGFRPAATHRSSPGGEPDPRTLHPQGGGGPRAKGDHGQDRGYRGDRGRRQAGPGGGSARPHPFRLIAVRHAC